jgi:hypothetical protein
VKHVAEGTARHFDDIILDDFFFTSCKSEEEIKARGKRSWSAYRVERMREVARNLVLGAARKINPRVRIVIPVVTLRNLATGAVLQKLPPVAPAARFSVTIPAHSYMAFSTR